jgi:hypothetical protein
MKTRAIYAALVAGVAAVAIAALPASARVDEWAVTITSGPAAKTTSTTATFTFTINPGWGVNTVICDLDGKVVDGSCKSPKTYTGLKVGEHTFTVTTYAGEIGVGKDSRTWIVDSTTPDFYLTTDLAQLPLTTKVFSTSTTPVKVQIGRLGGSKGPVSVPGATKSDNAFLLPIVKDILHAEIVPDNATNPSALMVSLWAKSDGQPVIGKSFTLTVAPGSPTVGSAPHSISIKYAVVNEYDLAVRGIDVTQGIQPDTGLPAGPTASYGGVKLVKDKRTTVRVFAAAVVSSLVKNVKGARIFLYGWWSKNGMAQSFGAPLVSPSVTISFSSGYDSPVALWMLKTTPPAATFTLPPSWTERGPIALEAKVLPASLFQPQAESECTSAACAKNNTYRLTNIPFTDTGYVNVWALYLRIKGGAFPCCPKDQVATFLPDTPLTAAGQLLPLADGELRTGFDWRAQYNATNPIKNAILFLQSLGIPKASLNDFLIRYSEDLEYHQVCPGTSSCPDVVMSMIDDTPTPAGYFVPGVTRAKTSPFPFLTAGTTLVNLRRPLSSTAHELGHSLSLKHASWGCGGNANGQKGDLAWPDPWGYLHGVGYDRRDGVEVYDGTGNGGEKNSTAAPIFPQEGWDKEVKSQAKSWYDFMSYCAGTDEYGQHAPAAGTDSQGVISPWKRTDAWIAVRNWNKLQSFLVMLKAAHAAQSVVGTLRSTFASEEATLAVDGFLLGGHGRVVLTRIQPRRGQPSAQAPSAYDLVLRNSDGGEIQRWPLTVTSSEGHDAESTFLSASVPLAGVEAGKLPTDLAELDVASGRSIVARVARSASAPAVRLLAPAEGDRVGTDTTTEVRWKATDADPGTSLDVAIDYSADDGKGWDTVYQGPNTGQAALASSRLSMSNQARIRVRVSDGFDETAVVSPRFSAVGRAPAITILSPRPAERGRSDAPLYLAATAYDDEGAFLDGRSVTWYDGRRIVARGRLAGVTGLAPGTHMLRVIARDPKDRAGEASVRVRIVPSAPAIILSRAPATVPQRARSVGLGLACSMRASLSVAVPTGVLRRGTCGPETRAVNVPIRPGSAPLQLELRAETQGQVSTLRLVFSRV